MKKDSIGNQLEIIEEANQWITNNLGGHKKKQAYRKFVDCRRFLKRKRISIESNPAVAIYGESQVGKSYLISSLLSEKGKPLGIKDQNGIIHNFIEKINPPGGGSESTSLISRFSVNYQPKYPDFPIKAVLLTPADLVLVLCDSFYKDINHTNAQNVLTTQQIDQKVQELKNNIQNRTEQQQYLTEDDILDIKDYFYSYFQTADRVLSSFFFEEIASIISFFKPEEWKDIFSLLWNNNKTFTELFNNLIIRCKSLGFSKEVFLPIESVLYTYGTLLDVKRLKEIFNTGGANIEPQYTNKTQVYLPIENNTIEFEKSYLCALTAELVFAQDESIVKSKPFLKNIDLLDFPGARARMETPEDAIENKNIPNLLLRGKVAYLFNKYSDSERLNILMFCAKHEQTAQRIMPRLLNNWVNKIIGDTPQRREEFIANSKVSPLFVIGTFFNINLAFNPQLDKADGTGTPLSDRWLQRFTTTLEKEYFEKDTYSWFEDWTNTKPNFQNIFLLRDFEKSETPSRLFTGYNANKRELEQVETPQYPNFRKELRESFLNYDFVKKHFANPEESWNEAATINKDGSQLIIKHLTIVAENINMARNRKIEKELYEIYQKILEELQKYYHSNDKDEELEKAKNIAGDIQFKLAAAFAADKIKLFGPLMKDFMLEESLVIEYFRSIIDDIEHRGGCLKRASSFFVFSGYLFEYCRIIFLQ